MPAAASAERVISERRAMSVSAPALASWAITVLRATSEEAPSCRCWIDTSSGKNFFTYTITPMPRASTATPKVSPMIGV